MLWRALRWNEIKEDKEKTRDENFLISVICSTSSASPPLPIILSVGKSKKSFAS
jgi:hypothetical protein